MPRRGTPHGMVSVRPQSKSNGKVLSWAIGVPAWMAEQVPEGATFIAEWHEEGILFRLAARIPERQPPGWVSQNSSRATVEKKGPVS